MNDSLKGETEKLARAWLQHDASFLREYLVAEVEDPRLNVQSVLSRHFIIATLFQGQFDELMLQELWFAAAMDWLTRLSKSSGGDAGTMEAVFQALNRASDNADGIEIPAWLARCAQALPREASGIKVPNYVESFLCPSADTAQSRTSLEEAILDTFAVLWSQALAGQRPRRLSVLEPACGSANDYRFLEAYGIARLIDYQGFDLSETNVANARALFPQVRFERGNVFEIPAADKTFDLCFAHDLLEHLSPAGLECAIHELCRVTIQGLCIGFFQMDEISDHVVRQTAQYYVNTLSLAKVASLFGETGFAVQALHIGSYLRWRIGCGETHNPNAYTLLSFRR